jgi:hypothetical protein
MAYRPQYAYPDSLEGFTEEDFVYYFDATNTPILNQIPVNTPLSRIPLQLQADAPFRLRAVQVSGNVGNLLLRFWDSFGNPLSQVLVEADRSYSGSEQGAQPIGRLPVVFEPEVPCPAGAVLLVDLELISP